MSTQVFKSATDQTLARLARIWKLTRDDGRVFLFTDHESAITFESETYIPGLGAEITASQRRTGLQDANTEVSGALSHESITDTDLRKGLFRNARVEFRIVDYRNPWAGALSFYSFSIVDVRWNGETWLATAVGPTHKLRIPEGINLTRNCRHNLGDSVCRVALEPFTRTGEVENIVAANLVFETDVNGPADFFRHGVLFWQTGNNAGASSAIRTFANGGFSLEISTLFPISIGDEFQAIAGCDKTPETCFNVFGNIANYGGFPSMPGPDIVNNRPPVRSGNPNGPPSQLRAEPGQVPDDSFVLR